MQPAPPAALHLASRLRQLRQQWRLTQEKLAKAFSDERSLAPATLSSWESLRSPKLPPEERIRAYARFFATPRSIAGKPKLFPLNELSEGERKVYDRLEAELVLLRLEASGNPPIEEPVIGRSWLFPADGRVTIVCAQLPDTVIGALGDPDNPNYTKLQTYADIDALVELFGHIRSENPTATVHFRTPSDVRSDDLMGHLIVLGGVIRNDMPGRLSELVKLPIRQVDDPALQSDEIFVADGEGRERKFWPKWADGDSKKVLIEDVGLFARVPNPLNASSTLTICNGVHSRGVYGAVRSLTDLEMRDSNEKYISLNFSRAKSFALLMSVKIIMNEVITPDFNNPDVVLHKWPQDAAKER
jgi:transcriptional regulator with XRE-family HTH domain